MKVRSEGEFEARFDFVRPIKPVAEERPGMWCIPFEYGDCPRGTRVSIAKAKEIAAALRADVAEAERLVLKVEFDKEKATVEDLKRREATAQLEKHAAIGELEALKRKLRARRKK